MLKRTMHSIIVAILLVIGSVWCQQDILDKLPDLTNLGDLSDINVNDLETAAIENYAKDALAVLKEKCSNVSGGNDVYKELEEKTTAFATFVKDNINATVVLAELDVAKKTGSMDEVFAKYCARKPEAMDRLKNITETFKKCLLPSEHKSLNDKLNMTDRMVQFLCEKDGDKIAMFIANGGEECLSSKFEGLQGCFNKSSSIMPSDNWQSLSLTDIDGKICEEFPALETCVVAVLEECKVKTPANIIGALFRYLKKNMDCAPLKQSVVAGDHRALDDFLTTNRVKRSTPSETTTGRFQRKCEKNAGFPEAFSNLNITFTNFMSALYHNVLVFGYDDCMVPKRNTEIEMEQFLLQLKKCLSSKEDFLPKFIRDAVASIFDYFCENDGKKLKEYKSAQGLQCLSNADMARFSTCIKPSYPHSTDGGEVILKETEFCNDVGQIRKCIVKELLPPCSQDRRFKEISEDLLERINDKCSGHAMFVNSFLFLCLVLFQFLKHIL